MTAENATISFNVRATGAVDAAAQFSQLSKSLGTSDDAAKKFNASASAANDNNAKLKQSGAAAAQAMNALSSGLSRISPELSGLQAAVGTFNGSIQGMLTLVGGGPGILLGGLIAAVSLLSREWADQKRIVAELDNAIDSANDRMKEHVETSSDYMARRESERKALAAQLKAENLANPSLDTYEGLMAARAEREAALAEIQSALDNKSYVTKRKVGGRKDEDFKKMIGSLSDSGGIGDVELNEAFGRDDSEINRLMELDAARAGSLDAFIDSKAKESQIFRESLSEKEAMVKRESELEKTRAGIAAAGAQALTGSMATLAKGHKVSIGSVIESIGDFMVADGTKNILQGIAISANPYTIGAGTPLIAAGGVELAAGLAMAAGGARSGGSSTKPGGGGGGRSGPSSPYPASGGGYSEGGGPQVVNVYMPTVVSPSAEDGRRVEAALSKSRNVFGRRAA